MSFLKKSSEKLGDFAYEIGYLAGRLVLVWITIILFWLSFNLRITLFWILAVAMIIFILIRSSFRIRLRLGPVLFIVFAWLSLAYITLPYIHKTVSDIYVPDYFIGRTRTTDGLLGDPINLAFLGTENEIHQAMTKAGWHKADPINLNSSWKMVDATLRNKSYPTAPVSSLILFSKPQDFAYQQEEGGDPGSRHHVRFWKVPDGWLLPGGYKADYLAAGTFDRSIGLSLFTMQITHKIDEDTDIERDHIVETLTTKTNSSVITIKNFSAGYHARNGGGDNIKTDGDLPVVYMPSAQAAAKELEAKESKKLDLY